MSIYGSLPAPGDDEHTDECARWVKNGDMWMALYPCDCGQPDAPLVYHGSQHWPAETDERGGYVDIAAPVSFDDDCPNPFLRFGVNDSTVVLTLRNVRQVAASLNEWLAGFDPVPPAANNLPAISELATTASLTPPDSVWGAAAVLDGETPA